MQQVICKTPHEFDGKRRAVGDKYLAEEKLVPVLEHLNWAEKYVEPTAQPQQQRIKRRAKGRS